jgi:hypothetical protein
MTRILSHVRHNVIAYLALFVALGGTGYAAIAIPNGSITAAKLNRHSIGGYVLAWAHVRSDGHVLSGSPGAVADHISVLDGQPPPATDNYDVGWRDVTVRGRCSALVAVDDAGPLSARGASAEAHVVPLRAFVRPGVKTHGQVEVDIANAGDQNVADNFYLAVVC